MGGALVYAYSRPVHGGENLRDTDEHVCAGVWMAMCTLLPWTVPSTLEASQSGWP